jgi:hypothetical protein
MPLAGRKLTYLEVAALCYKYGLRGRGLVTAIAVCEYESSMFEGAWNENEKTKDRSYGLFQINVRGVLWLARKIKYGLKTKEDLYHAETNVRIMADMSKKGTNWKPWGAYTNGMYMRAWFSAQAAAAAVDPTVTSPVVYLGEVQPGATGPLVYSIQRALVAKKLLTGVNGKFDATTEKAYKAWQKQCGFPGDGKPGAVSLAKLLPGFVVKS